MPIRTTLQRRGSGEVDLLCENIRQGIPWNIPLEPPRGYSDLIYLVTGHLYFPDFIRSNDDIETMLSLWEPLREEILTEHIKHEPKSRPWAWWALEDREPRERLTVACSCPPPSRNPGLPPATLSWFGTRRGCRCEHEEQADYLRRFKVL